MSDTATNGPGGPTVEVEFAIDDPRYPFVSASEAEACVFELAEMVPRNDGQYAEFFNVTGTQPERIVDLATSHDTVDVAVLDEYDDGGLFEFLTSGDCPAFALAERGALPREAVSADGEGRIVADIPPQYDPDAIVDEFLAETPGVQLVAKRRIDTFPSLFTRSTVERIPHERLTDRQREVVRTAYESGYYEWPRQCEAADVADELDITTATFSEHVRVAERKLLTVLFDG